MEANELVTKARDLLIAANTDEHLKECHQKYIQCDEELVNYVMNKILDKARSEGGRAFLGTNEDLNEFIVEFYLDYDKLNTKLFKNNWEKYIRGIADTPKTEPKPEVKKEEPKPVKVEKPKKSEPKEEEHQTTLFDFL